MFTKIQKPLCLLSLLRVIHVLIKLINCTYVEEKFSVVQNVLYCI